MKIAFFTDSYFPMINGVTISVANLADELRILGHTVYIFAPKFDDYVDTEKNIYRLKSFKVLDMDPAVHMPFMLPHQILKDIQPLEFDIIHAHGNGFFSLLGYQVALMKGIPFLLTFHTQLTLYTHYILKGKIITPRVAATTLRLLGNMCDTAITPSVKMSEELVSYGVKKPIRVVPNFVYSEKLTSNEKGFLHDFCDIPVSSVILLTVARLGKEKNLMFLLRAFKKIADGGTGAHLVIVGRGDEELALKKYVLENNLNNLVHFTGRIQPKEMVKVYSGADIFVFSSISEVHPMVILEAGAAGLPFVVVDDGAYKNIIETGKNGYIVSQHAQEFASRTLDLINSPETRQKFGIVSKNTIETNFSPKKLTLQMLDVYQETIANKKPSRMNIRSINRATLKRFYQMTDIIDKIFQ